MKTGRRTQWVCIAEAEGRIDAMAHWHEGNAGSRFCNRRSNWWMGMAVMHESRQIMEACRKN